MYTVPQECKQDLDAVSNYASEIYNNTFSSYLKDVKELYTKVQDAEHIALSDTDLEWILTTLPLNLFTISENLNDLRLRIEVLKLKSREKADAKESVLEYQILRAIYDAVVSRVENELSFSRELIMGAKKIWDARRRAETPVVGEVVTEESSKLPDYVPDSSKRSYYVR